MQSEPLRVGRRWDSVVVLPPLRPSVSAAAICAVPGGTRQGPRPNHAESLRIENLVWPGDRHGQVTALRSDTFKPRGLYQAQGAQRRDEAGAGVWRERGVLVKGDHRREGPGQDELSGAGARAPWWRGEEPTKGATRGDKPGLGVSGSPGGQGEPRSPLGWWTTGPSLGLAAFTHAAFPLGYRGGSGCTGAPGRGNPEDGSSP